MIITLTKVAHTFAERHEGAGALYARAEQELEILTADTLRQIGGKIFSWNGEDNIFLSALTKEVALVDLIDDDDGELEIPLDPHGGQEPDAVPIPSAKE